MARDVQSTRIGASYYNSCEIVEDLDAMASGRGLIADFQRVFDEFFDDMLIDRWKAGTSVLEFERAQVVDRGDRYEVRVAAAGVDPAKIQAEVSGQRLSLRVPDKLGGSLENSFSFSHTIDGEASTAKFIDGTLVITLPKMKARRIALKTG